MTTRVIASESELRELIGRPMDLALAKAIDHLDKYCRAYIARSPFLIIGTSGPDGRGDVSPRGDQPGFVQVIDDHTLFIPDRPGNNRLDTMTNIIANPDVGLLFLVPGFDDCLRVNGQAQLVCDDALLGNAQVNGRTPKIGIRVRVAEAYLHCAKAIRRAQLWDPTSQHDRGALPSIGRMVLEQSAPPQAPPATALVAEVDAAIEDNYRNEMY